MKSSSPVLFHPYGREVDAAGLVAKSKGALAVLPPIARSQKVRARELRSFRFRDLTLRALNFIVAALLIVLSAPLMVLIALAVRLTSRGPVIYAQERVGLNSRQGTRRREKSRFGGDRRETDRGGRIFRIYKFRTMLTARSRTHQVWSGKHDPRVTWVGRFLRSHRLDELPQLFNVLMGDMNLVGPRPEQPEIFEELRRTIPVYSERQTVRPGITGWAQVNHRYDASVRDVRKKLFYDLEYVRRRSIAKDVVIMAKTPSVMLFRKGSH